MKALLAFLRALWSFCVSYWRQKPEPKSATTIVNRHVTVAMEPNKELPRRILAMLTSAEVIEWFGLDLEILDCDREEEATRLIRGPSPCSVPYWGEGAFEDSFSRAYEGVAEGMSS